MNGAIADAIAEIDILAETGSVSGGASEAYSLSKHVCYACLLEKESAKELAQAGAGKLKADLRRTKAGS